MAKITQRLRRSTRMALFPAAAMLPPGGSKVYVVFEISFGAK